MVQLIPVSKGGSSNLLPSTDTDGCFPLVTWNNGALAEIAIEYAYRIPTEIKQTY